MDSKVTLCFVLVTFFAGCKSSCVDEVQNMALPNDLAQDVVSRMRAAAGECFCRIDFDDNGIITIPEIQAAVAKSSKSINATERIGIVDIDGDGKFSVRELFGIALVFAARISDESKLKMVFWTVDFDNDGFISKDELMKIASFKDKITNTRLNTYEIQTKVEALMHGFDGNKDGKFDYAEFLAAAKDKVLEVLKKMREIIDDKKNM